MSAPILQSRVLYGLKTDVAGNAHYITDSDVLYPVGGALAIHNFSQRRQRLLRLPDKHVINIIAVTPNKKYVAVCETGDKPTINIYDVQTLKKKKCLGIPYDVPGVTRFACISFTFDSRYLAAVTGQPDQTMLFYAWEKGKVESSIKLANPQNNFAMVKCIACNPGDIGVIAVGGPHTFKFLTVSETIWRPYGFAKAENILVCSMTWLNNDRLLTGTRDGRILYLENGDLKNIYKMSDIALMNLKIREEYVIQTTISQSSITDADDDGHWDRDVRNLVAFQRGFAFGLGPGTIIVFERDGQNKYVKRNVYVVPAQSSKNSTTELYKINSIAVNPSGDGLLITTGWSQLFNAKLWGPDIRVDPEPRELGVTGQNLHHGSIIGLSICSWKSVFITCGEIDRSVRIWDYETENLLMTKQYQEDVFSVAMHPIGLFCAIGFSDKLRFMSILMNDLQTMRELPIRNCRKVVFSHGGHLLAAVNGNVIQIYTTIGFENRHRLKGHTGKIRDIVWSSTDASLVSIGSEGAIYDWDADTGNRKSEIIVKGVNLNGIVITTDGTTIYCISDDRRLREIRDNAIIREYGSRSMDMEIVTMGKDDFAMFVACPGGVIVAHKLPLQDPLDGMEFNLHCADLTNLRLSYDEKILISTGSDGTLGLWKITKSDGPTLSVDGEFKRTNEILIGKDDLEEKVRTIENLTTRMRELETEQAYKIRQTEVQHNDKMREVHQGYCEAIEELREKIETMQEDRTNELNSINVEIAKMKMSHDETLKKMEINYDEKLINEYDKYRSFEERNNEMRRNYEKRLTELENKMAVDMEILTKNYEARVHSKNLELEETHEEMAHQARVHEMSKQQIENDADREIVDLRTTYENRLHEERQTNLKLKGEAGVLRNKYFATRKDIDEFKRQIENFHVEQTNYQKTIQDLENDVRDLKKEIIERDATIQDKEKRIYDLKRNNQELEKFKFVLNYKIRELKNQIEPRDRDINDLNEKIRDMEIELVNLQKLNVSLELQLQELQRKLRGSKLENKTETSRRINCESSLRKIRMELSMAAELIQRPNELKMAVVKLHRRWSANDELTRGRTDDLDARCEFGKQREHLERTVRSLKKRVVGSTGDDDERVEGMLDDNVTIIVELNGLREELKRARKRMADMESLLGISGRKLHPEVARRRLDEACHGNDELRRRYETKMRECERIVETMKDYIENLIANCETIDVDAKDEKEDRESG